MEGSLPRRRDPSRRRTWRGKRATPRRARGRGEDGRPGGRNGGTGRGLREARTSRAHAAYLRGGGVGGDGDGTERRRVRWSRVVPTSETSFDTSDLVCPPSSHPTTRAMRVAGVGDVATYGEELVHHVVRHLLHIVGGFGFVRGSRLARGLRVLASDDDALHGATHRIFDADGDGAVSARTSRRCSRSRARSSASRTSRSRPSSRRRCGTRASAGRTRATPEASTASASPRRSERPPSWTRGRARSWSAPRNGSRAARAPNRTTTTTMTWDHPHLRPRLRPARASARGARSCSAPTTPPRDPCPSAEDPTRSPPRPGTNISETPLVPPPRRRESSPRGPGPPGAISRDWRDQNPRRTRNPRNPRLERGRIRTATGYEQPRNTATTRRDRTPGRI